MTEIWAAYAAAFTLGATHALEVDHMVAVTTFAGGRPRLRSAVLFGVRWGIGHAAVVLLAGAALAGSGLAIPDRLSGWTELAVGLALIGLGLWATRSALRLHYHDPHTHGNHAGTGHAHLHAHDPAAHPHDHAHADPAKRHRHLPTLIGAVHGLAGTAPAMALIPVTLLDDIGAAVGYLAAFGIGTTLAMGTYASLAALAAGMASRVRTARAVALVTAVASGGVGMWWIVRAVQRL